MRILMSVSLALAILCVGGGEANAQVKGKTQVVIEKITFPKGQLAEIPYTQELSSDEKGFVATEVKVTKIDIPFNANIVPSIISFTAPAPGKGAASSKSGFPWEAKKEYKVEITMTYLDNGGKQTTTKANTTVTAP